MTTDNIAMFQKVSFEEYLKARKKMFAVEGEYGDDELFEEWKNIKLPQRATMGSAGYDFSIPMEIYLTNESQLFPTGIRAKMEVEWVLKLYPRSGLGFKYRLQLNNTVGIIDSDYYGSSNEGHIYIKITNDSKDGKILSVNKGEAFAQGIFLQFAITVDDESDNIRNGGFGSTN